jgi:hypothetical protein
MALVKWVVLVASLGLLAGCSSSAPTGGEAAASYTLLQEVNELLHLAAGPTGRPLGKLADLDRFRSTYPRAYEAIKSGDAVVLWGTPLKGEGEVGKDEVVVAYEKGVPANGGYVLLNAGSVKKMSASEFNSAPKAVKK